MGSFSFPEYHCSPARLRMSEAKRCAVACAAAVTDRRYRALLGLVLGGHRPSLHGRAGSSPCKLSFGMNFFASRTVYGMRILGTIRPLEPQPIGERFTPLEPKPIGNHENVPSLVHSDRRCRGHSHSSARSWWRCCRRFQPQWWLARCFLRKHGSPERRRCVSLVWTDSSAQPRSSPQFTHEPSVGFRTHDPGTAPNVLPLFVPDVRPVAAPSILPVFVPDLDPAVDSIIQPALVPDFGPALSAIIQPALGPIGGPFI